jgi:hypothetical protein
MKANLDAFRGPDADFLIRNVSSRFRPIFVKREYSEDEKRAIYRYLFSRRPKRRASGGSWRLPDNYQRSLVSTVSDFCAREGIRFKHCMYDMLIFLHLEREGDAYTHEAPV